MGLAEYNAKRRAEREAREAIPGGESLTNARIGAGAEPAEPAEDRVLTVNGEPIPPHLAHLVAYENTDQGIAEKNATRGRTSVKVSVSARDPRESRRRVTASDVDKAIVERREFRGSEATEVWEAPDPMKELVDAHIGPEMRPRFISPAKCARDGLRGWKPVMSNGEQVKLGNLILAEMPEPKARAREEHFRSKNQSLQEELKNEFLAKREELEVEAKVPRGSLRAGDPDGSLDGLRSTRGSSQLLDTE